MRPRVAPQRLHQVPGVVILEQALLVPIVIFRDAYPRVPARSPACLVSPLVASPMVYFAINEE
jgi:hypothetical protein